MDVLRRIFRRAGWVEGSGVIDHMPVSAECSRDWREERLKQAQEKYGRPFKCAGAELEREILVRPRPAGDFSLDSLREPDAPQRRSKPRPRRPSTFRFGGR